MKKIGKLRKNDISMEGDLIIRNYKVPEYAKRETL